MKAELDIKPFLKAINEFRTVWNNNPAFLTFNLPFFDLHVCPKTIWEPFGLKCDLITLLTT